MIGLDTNVILHFLIDRQEKHREARAWFQKVNAPLATTPVVIGELLRLLTHPRVFSRPLTLEKSVQIIENFRKVFDLTVLEESETWWGDLVAIGRKHPNVVGNEIFDARIAVCLRHNGVQKFCTLDSDFQKYTFLELIAF